MKPFISAVVLRAPEIDLATCNGRHSVTLTEYARH
jgi:hypothetical protein